jgi:hypothetical protein
VEKIVKENYIKGMPISVKKTEFYKHCKIVVGNGRSISFWKNTWSRDPPLAARFPRLFDLKHDKDISVEKVLSSGFHALSFRRRIMGNLVTIYKDLVDCCSNYCVTNQEDKVVSFFGKKGFSVNSLYRRKMCN